MAEAGSSPTSTVARPRGRSIAATSRATSPRTRSASAFPSMSTATARHVSLSGALESPPVTEVADAPAADRSAYEGVLRYYELAKRAEWQVRDLPWADAPAIPQYKGSPQKLARRNDLWRSVITQQLQADELAVEMATQLFRMAPEPEAKLYYTTMVQDESRHTEAWLRLTEEAGGRGERDPYLDQLAKMQLEAESIEEKVVNMQVFYERLIIPRFRLIARSSRGTVLEDLCNRLTVDDGIHHGSGMAYARVLIANAPEPTRARQERLGLEGVVVEHDLEPYGKATEALTGVAPVPVAVVGPLELELGDYELEEPSGALVERGRTRDAVYVPLANTEGGLSISLYRGARAASESGGFRTYVLRDRVTRASAFLFQDVANAVAFATWIEAQVPEMRAWLDSADVAGLSRHAKLREVET